MGCLEGRDEKEGGLISKRHNTLSNEGSERFFRLGGPDP
jgi:hypothetical protein